MPARLKLVPDVAREVGQPLPIDVVSGTSIGAVHAAALAVWADDPQSKMKHLAARWTALSLDDVIRVDRAHLQHDPRCSGVRRATRRSTPRAAASTRARSRRCCRRPWIFAASTTTSPRHADGRVVDRTARRLRRHDGLLSELFDGRFARDLIQLGWQDAERRHDQLVGFFTALLDGNARQPLAQALYFATLSRTKSLRTLKSTGLGRNVAPAFLASDTVSSSV